jgi:hypothetical protein
MTAVIAQPTPKANRHYVERTVVQLNDGDVFSLNPEGGDSPWYTATGIAHSDMVLVVAEGGGTVRIPAAEDQICLVEVDYVKVRVNATVKIDVSAWAAEYGIDREDVAADAREYFANFTEAAMPEHLRPIVDVL